MTNRRRKHTASPVLLFLLSTMVLPSSVLWAQNENESVGFRPNHIFESGQFGENIDIMNGGLNLTMPVGPRFQVNARLGYGLTLSYNSKVWDPTYYRNRHVPDDREQVVPYNESPLGIGFSLHMGRIFREQSFLPDGSGFSHFTPYFTSSWKWVSPDGTQHEFWFDPDTKPVESEDGVSVDESVGASGATLPQFTRRETNDLSYARVSGPGDGYCSGLMKDDGVTPESGCFRVETADGLTYTLVKRVECELLPNAPHVDYQRLRAENQSFCGWYTALIADRSVGTSNVRITYDSRRKFEHAIASISDSTGRRIDFHNCEWRDEGNPLNGHCSLTTSQRCNSDSHRCPGTEQCVVDGAAEDIVEKCVTGSKDPGHEASRRAAVATYAIDFPAFGNSEQLDATRRATYTFMYEYGKVKSAHWDRESLGEPTCTESICPPMLSARQVLKLLRVDYPAYRRPGHTAPDDQELYSLYFGYRNAFGAFDLAYGGNGDYGEVTCRTLPVLRRSGGGTPLVRGNACSGAGDHALFLYSHGYYKYISAFLSMGRVAHKTCQSLSASDCTGAGGGAVNTGVSRQIVEKSAYLPSGGPATPRWRYNRVSVSTANPTKVVVTDSFDNDTVYFYNSSMASMDPAISGSNPEDGLAPEWDDGTNYRIDYYQGGAETGRLVRSELQAYDSDLYAGRRAKSNTRVQRITTQYFEDGAVESVVSRESWDDFGHWRVETESGFGLSAPRITRTEYQKGTPSVYKTDLVRFKEASDGQRVLSRTDYEYDGVGNLKTSIGRMTLPAAIGGAAPAPPLAATQRPGDVLTTYTHSAASGNVLTKTISTGRTGETSYQIKYGYVPALGTCTVVGECGGYLASKEFLEGGVARFKSIDRERDANTGLIMATRDTAGARTSYTYDDLGRVTLVSPAGEEPTVIDYESLRSTVVTQGTRAADDLAPGADFVLTRHLYDGLGRQVATQKRPADPSTGKFACQRTQYDRDGRVLYRTEWQYLTPGACVPLPEPAAKQCWAEVADRTLNPGTEYDYREPGTSVCDPFGRVRLEIPTDADQANRPTGNKIVRTDYFGTSHQVTVHGVRGPSGNAFPATTVYLKDALGRLVTVDSSTGGRCSTTGTICTSDASCGGGTCVSADGGADAYYTYDALDRLQEVKLSDNLDKLQFRRFAYDGLGQLLWAEHPESGTTVYQAYDALGNLLSFQDAQGNLQKFTYDFAGRLRQHSTVPYGSLPERVVARNTYDEPERGASAGKLTTIESMDESGARLLTEQRFYEIAEAGGRPSKTVHLFEDWNGATETTNYLYNARGQVSLLRYPAEIPATRSLLSVNYRYANGSVVSAIEDPAGMTLGSLTYNAAGAVETLQTPGGGATTVTFDSRNRPSRITGGVQDPNTLTWSYDSGAYNYDGAGNIYEMGANRYGYDAANRLISARTVYGGLVYDESFAYDPFGNMDQRQLTPLGGSQETEDFTFSTPRDNRVMTRQTMIGSLSQSAVNLVYDANGNLIEGGRRHQVTPQSPILEDIKRFEYSTLNRLLGIHQVGSVSTGTGLASINRFGYDASGQRVWKVESGPGLKTWYVRDAAGQVLSEFRRVENATSTPEWSKDYIYLAGRLLALKENLRPEPPRGLRASQTKVGSKWLVSLTWDENTEPDRNGYSVYRMKEGVDPDFLKIASTSSASHADPTEYAGGSILLYRVTASDTAGFESAPSAVLRISAGDISGPSAPTITSIIAGNRQVALVWSSSTDASGIAGYEVSRRPSLDAARVPVNTQLVTGNTLTDLNLQNDQTYYYVVRAKDMAGNWGAYSCKCCVKGVCDWSAVPKDYTPPVPPRGLTITTVCGAPGEPEKLRISWEPNPDSDNVVSYELFRSTTSTFAATDLVTRPDPASTLYEETSLSPGADRFYAVKAVERQYEPSTPQNRSALSEIRAGRVRDHTIVPQVSLMAKGADGAVTLKWSAVGTYRLYRKLNATEGCGSYTYVADLPTDKKEFTDGSPENNAAYDYALTTIVSNRESSFSKPALSIPLDRPSNLFQCYADDPWLTGDNPSTYVQWTPPVARFYQPYLASTTEGTYGFLKGYHLYHHKICGVPLVFEQYTTFQDNSPTRQVVVDPADPVDRYLIERSDGNYGHQDPRYLIGSSTSLSPPFSSAEDRSLGNPFLTCANTPDYNCVMPKAVYKVYAEGTWLTVESGWPDHFDALEPDPFVRCRNPLKAPPPLGPSLDTYLGPCGVSGRDANFVPTPRNIRATSTGPGTITLEWDPPSIPAGKPQIAGYYLYAQQNSTTFRPPLPFAVAGPGERAVTLTGLGTGGHSFTVATLDQNGRASDPPRQRCEESGVACSPTGVCPTSVCSNTGKRCSATSECSTFKGCDVSGVTCSTDAECANVCSDTGQACISPRVQSQRGANSGTNQVTVTLDNPPVNGNALVAVIGTRGMASGRVTSITQTGAIWVNRWSVNFSWVSQGLTVDVWYALNVNTAGREIVINLEEPLKASAVVAEYRGLVTAATGDPGRGNSQGVAGLTAYAGNEDIDTNTASELWVGAIANIGIGTYSNPTNYFAEVDESASLGGDASTRNNLVFYEKVVNYTGRTNMQATLSEAAFWGSIMVTFRTSDVSRCPGAACIAPACLADTCQREACEATASSSRWCVQDPGIACADPSQDCPKYNQGRCNATTAQSCDPRTPNCPTGEVCVQGDSCAGETNSVFASAGSGPARPLPPAPLKTILWTVNDRMTSRGRNGIKLAWAAAPKTTPGLSAVIEGFRVYRSLDPEGPYCALLDTDSAADPRTVPLPQGVTGVCASDVPLRRTVDEDAYSKEYSVAFTSSSTTYTYWDQTVAGETVYHYRVTQLERNAAGVYETPSADAYRIEGQQLGYEENVLPPPQGFRAWAPQHSYEPDRGGIYARWCPIPAAPDLPPVAEYRLYRKAYDQVGTYLLARLDPACIAEDASGTPINRCEITLDANVACVDNGGTTRPCDVIHPVACGTSGKPCAVADLTHNCWPRRIDVARADGFNAQYSFNYNYFVTAVQDPTPATAGTDLTESMPSTDNQGWLNYCSWDDEFTSRCERRTGNCNDRRDPDGDGEFLVCGDENARLEEDMLGVAEDALVCAAQSEHAPLEVNLAPYRVIGQVIIDDGGGGGGTNPYNPPARFAFYHLDHLGSPRVITTAYGTVLSSHHYLPFGEERPVQVDPTLNTRAFTGHERDSETGLDYMMARYYSSSLARFMAVDPGDDSALEDPQSWNKYAYVRNNPLALVDPDGESATLAGALIGGAAAGAVALAQGKSWSEVGAAAAGGAVAGAMVGSVIDTGGASLGVMVAAGAMGGAAGVLTESMGNGQVATAGDVAMGAAAGAAGVMAGASVGAVMEGAAARGATSAAAAGETPASTPVGSSRSPMKVAPGTNAPATVGGTSYSGHAVDSMQSRGIPPSAAQNAAQTGARAPGNRPGTTTHHDATNNVTAVTNTQTKTVVTVRKGEP